MKKVTVYLFMAVNIFGYIFASDIKEKAQEYYRNLTQKDNIDDLQKAIKLWQAATADPEYQRAAREEALHAYAAQLASQLNELSSQTSFIHKK